jgi:hypothetical protein
MSPSQLEALNDFKIIAKPAWHAYHAAVMAADQQYKAVNKAAFDRCMSMIAVADKLYLVSRDGSAFRANLERAFEEYEATMKVADETRKKASEPAWKLYEAVTRPAWEAFQVAMESS